MSRQDQIGNLTFSVVGFLKTTLKVKYPISKEYAVYFPDETTYTMTLATGYAWHSM